MAALATCGALGWWQWQRAVDHAVTVDPEPAVELTDLLSPSSNPNHALGRQVVARGTWIDQPGVLIWGRDVDSTEAVFLMWGLSVHGEQEGTLAVVVGWAPADAVRSGETVVPDLSGSAAELHGYLRGSEAARGTDEVQSGAVSMASMSTAVLAQTWPTPMYAPVMVSYTTVEPWRVLPPREPERDIDLRSASYAVQWWVFGLFAGGLAARHMRDNRWRLDPTGEDTTSD